MDDYRLAEDLKFKRIEKMLQKQKAQSNNISIENETISNSIKTERNIKNPFLLGMVIGLVITAVFSITVFVSFNLNNNDFKSSYDNMGGFIAQLSDEIFNQDDNNSGHLSIEYLQNLDPYVWNTLTNEEKYNTINAVIINEQYSLGVIDYNDAVFKAEDLDDRLWGSYWHFDKSITIDKNHLENDDVYDVVKTACHETRHLYQHTMIDLYESKNKDWKKLASEEDILKYKNDFDNYVSALDGDEYFNEYYNQYVEIDAREYGANRAEYYQSLVDYYNL